VLGPVSVFAAALYVAVVALLLRPATPRSARELWRGRCLDFIALLIALEAVWFVGLQALVLDAFCPYCLAAHALGVALALRVLWRGRATRSGGLRALSVSAAAATALGALIAGLQATAEHSTHGLGGADLAAAHELDSLRLFDGQLVLATAEEPVLGPVAAERRIVVMLDYACPHCRHTHELLHALLEQPEYRGRVAVFLLPVPLNHRCNAFAPVKMHSRFDESCELARTALALWDAGPADYPDFQRWLYEPAVPRTAAEARHRAAELVGENNLQRALSNPTVDLRIARNVRAYGLVGDERRLPVVMAPGKPTLLGRVEDVPVLAALVDGDARRDGRAKETL
jgi:protein-disulfide isomerase